MAIDWSVLKASVEGNQVSSLFYSVVGVLQFNSDSDHDHGSIHVFELLNRADLTSRNDSVGLLA